MFRDSSKMIIWGVDDSNGSGSACRGGGDLAKTWKSGFAQI